MYKRRNDYSEDSSSAGSSLYLTLPHAATDGSDVVMTYKVDGRAKVAQQGDGTLSSRKPAGSTDTLELGLISENNSSLLSVHVSTETLSACSLTYYVNSGVCSSRIHSSSSVSSIEGSDNSDADVDSDISMAHSGGCGDITLVHDKSLSPPQNEAEVMFMQIVEILKFEKKVNHHHCENVK